MKKKKLAWTEADVDAYVDGARKIGLFGQDYWDYLKKIEIPIPKLNGKRI